jgi:hypothetical protein
MFFCVFHGVFFYTHGVLRVPLAVPLRRTWCVTYLAAVFLMKGDVMDPTVSYAEMTEAMEQADRLHAEARERAKTLDEWIKKGGFYPKGDSPEMVRIWINVVLSRTHEPEEC